MPTLNEKLSATQTKLYLVDFYKKINGAPRVVGGPFDTIEAAQAARGKLSDKDTIAIQRRTAAGHEIGGRVTIHFADGSEEIRHYTEGDLGTPEYARWVRMQKSSRGVSSRGASPIKNSLI